MEMHVKRLNRPKKFPYFSRLKNDQIFPYFSRLRRNPAQERKRTPSKELQAQKNSIHR